MTSHAIAIFDPMTPGNNGYQFLVLVDVLLLVYSEKNESSFFYWPGCYEVRGKGECWVNLSFVAIGGRENATISCTR